MRKKNLPWDFKKCHGSLQFTLLSNQAVFIYIKKSRQKLK